MRSQLCFSAVVGVLLAAVWMGPACEAASAKPGGSHIPKVMRLDIVDAAIEHHGGALFERSRARFEVCSKSGCSRVEVTVRDGLYDYDVTGNASRIERRVRSTNGGVDLWEEGEPVSVDEPRRRQQLRDWAMQRVYFNFLPFRLNDPSVYKQDLGLETWGSRKLRKVKVTFEPGSSTDASDEYLYWFEPRTARLEMFAYSYEVNGGGLRFRRLGSHRRVGGLLFYDQENWGAEGPGLSVDLVTSEYVESEMRHVSTIEMRGIEVSPVD